VTFEVIYLKIAETLEMSKLAMSHFLWHPENIGPAYISQRCMVSAPPH